jgi:hypothetical protein
VHPSEEAKVGECGGAKPSQNRFVERSHGVSVIGRHGPLDRLRDPVPPQSAFTTHYEKGREKPSRHPKTHHKGFGIDLGELSSSSGLPSYVGASPRRVSAAMIEGCPGVSNFLRIVDATLARPRFLFGRPRSTYPCSSRSAAGLDRTEQTSYQPPHERRGTCNNSLPLGP